MNQEEYEGLLSRLDERTLALTKKLDEYTKSQRDLCCLRYGDHEERIRSLEAFKLKFIGGAIVVGMISGALVGVVAGALV